MKHRADPVQQIFSRALVGFALNQKCRVLSEASESDYEQHLNRAGVVFQGYVVAQQMVPGPHQALGYVREMTLGAVGYAASSACDAAAHEAVRSGHETARDFVPQLRRLFDAPARTQ